MIELTVFVATTDFTNSIYSMVRKIHLTFLDGRCVSSTRMPGHSFLK
jgi:hypothetical protein